MSKENKNKVTELVKWDNFNRVKIENKHKIIERAKIDGSNNIPKSENSTYTECENEIKTELDEYVSNQISKGKKFFNNLENKLDSLETHLGSNHFLEIVNKLKLDLSNLKVQVNLKLNEYKKSLEISKEELLSFKRLNQIGRNPEAADSSTILTTLALLTLLFFVEVFLNSNLLKSVLPGGEIEGYAFASVIAAINVIASFFVGYYVFKQITHVQKAKKIFGYVIGSIYSIFILYTNLCLGAYRAEAERIAKKQLSMPLDTISPGFGFEFNNFLSALEQATRPWTVSFSLMAFGLTCIGIFFAICSILKGFFFNDTYPGYGTLGQQVIKFKNLIKTTLHEFTTKATKTVDSTTKEINNLQNKLIHEDLDSWGHNVNLLQMEFVNFKRKIEEAEKDADHIILEYRERNKSIRSTPAPEYFSNSFKLHDDKKDPYVQFVEVKESHKNDIEKKNKKKEFEENIIKKFEDALGKIKGTYDEFLNDQEKIQNKYEIN